MKISLVSIITAGTILLFTTPVFAQNARKLTDTQLALNEQAIEAQQNGDLDKALQYVQSMIELGEADALWLQLGRLYELQGKCIGAMDAYEHVKTAPPTEDVPHDVILQKLIDNSDSLKQTCSAVLVFDCKMPDMNITVDNDKTIACSSAPIYVTPGRHTIHAQSQQTSNIVNITLSLEKSKVMSIEVTDTGYSFEGSHLGKPYTIAGWTLLGSGVALAAAGGAVYGVAHKDFKQKSDDTRMLCSQDPLNADCKFADKTNNKYIAAYTLMGVGGAVALTGAALLIVNAIKNNKADESYATTPLFITPYFGPEHNGVEFIYQF